MVEARLGLCNMIFVLTNQVDLWSCESNPLPSLFCLWFNVFVRFLVISLIWDRLLVWACFLHPMTFEERF
jgi:hypothetical protein